METKLLSVRVDASLADRADRLACVESKRIGVRVGRTSFIARALLADVEAREKEDEQRGKQVLYISGPITGMPGLNKAAFNDAARRLRECGFVVVNPVDNGVPDSAPWADHMRADIRQMMDCSGMALLPGWGDSKGVALEKQIAEKLCFDIRPLSEWLTA